MVMKPFKQNKTFTRRDSFIRCVDVGCLPSDNNNNARREWASTLMTTPKLMDEPRCQGHGLARGDKSHVIRRAIELGREEFWIVLKCGCGAFQPQPRSDPNHERLEATYNFIVISRGANLVPPHLRRCVKVSQTTNFVISQSGFDTSTNRHKHPHILPKNENHKQRKPSKKMGKGN